MQSEGYPLKVTKSALLCTSGNKFLTLVLGTKKLFSIIYVIIRFQPILVGMSQAMLPGTFKHQLIWFKIQITRIFH